MQTAEHRSRRDGARWGADQRQGCFHAQRAVGSRAVVVADLRGQHGPHGPQGRLVQDDHVVQALPPERADDPLSDSVGNRFRLHAVGTLGAVFESLTRITRSRARNSSCSATRIRGASSASSTVNARVNECGRCRLPGLM